MSLFKNNTAQNNFGERQILEAKYTNARHDILLMIIFSLINAVLIFIDPTEGYFLFSAAIPRFLISTAMFMCGKMPVIYYEGLDGMELWDDSILIVMSIIAFAVIGIYVILWFMSKKKVGWLTAAVVFVSMDTLALILLFGIRLDNLIDILFHAYIIYCLVRGIIAHNKLKYLPEEDELLEVVDFEEAHVVEGAPAEIVEAAEAAPETVEKAPETDVEQ